MYINGLPFTNFRAVNVRGGLARIGNSTIGTTDYSLILKAAPGTFTDNNKVYLKDGTGSMFIKGYHVTYGTTSISCSGIPAAGAIATSSIAISGVLTTSIVLINAFESASTDCIPFGATCQTAGKILVQYYVGAASTAITSVPITYTILHPQTS